jgi:hypothetical protein
MTEEQSTRKWIEEAEEALNRIGDSLKAAWDETQDARMATLQSAREATTRLGETIDQGIAAARKRWEPDSPSSTEEPTTSSEEE